MDILFNLFEFYNLGFFVGFLFLNSISTKVYIYVVAYYMLANFDKNLRQLEIDGAGIEKLYRWLFNLVFSVVGLLMCDSLKYRNLYITLNLRYFHMLVFIFSAIQCISQFWNHGDNTTINIVHLYLRVMFVIIMLSELLGYV